MTARKGSLSSSPETKWGTAIVWVSTEENPNPLRGRIRRYANRGQADGLESLDITGRSAWRSDRPLTLLVVAVWAMTNMTIAVWSATSTKQTAAITRGSAAEMTTRLDRANESKSTTIIPPALSASRNIQPMAGSAIINRRILTAKETTVGAIPQVRIVDAPARTREMGPRRGGGYPVVFSSGFAVSPQRSSELTVVRQRSVRGARLHCAAEITGRAPTRVRPSRAS